MSLLGGLKGSDDSNIEEEQDIIGGSGPLDSAAYESKVSMAYLLKSKGGALGLTLWLKCGKREIRNTQWVTSGDAKGNKKYYEKDGEKKFLPGYNMATSLCLLTLGKTLEEMETEMKLVGIYDFTLRKDVNTEVEVLTGLIGQDIITGLLRETVDKNVKDDAGNYVPSGEIRDQNEVDKFFRAKDKLTTAEIRGGVSEPVFYNTWCEKNTGVTRDKSTKTSGAGATNSAFQAGSSAAAKPAGSLFTS